MWVVLCFKNIKSVFYIVTVQASVHFDFLFIQHKVLTPHSNVNMSFVISFVKLPCEVRTE